MMENLISIQSFCLILFLFLQGYFKALADLEQFKQSDSWKNKYKQPFKKGKRKWYYLWIYVPTYEEAFPYSTTFLVFTTDLWHFYNFLYYRSKYLSITATIFWLTQPLNNYTYYFVIVFCNISLPLCEGIFRELTLKLKK